MSSSMTPHRDPVILTSWKEVAHHLGRSVRTVQRWEAQFGLPVQRPDGHQTGIIHASTAELDEWLATQWSPKRVPWAIQTDSVAEVIDASHELRTQHRKLIEMLQSNVDASRNGRQKSVLLLEITMNLCNRTARLIANSKDAAVRKKA